jgi:hypothetical protein
MINKNFVFLMALPFHYQFKFIIEYKLSLPVSEIKGFFNTITMMNVYINVQNTSMVFQKLQNPQNQVIDVTKTRCPALFCMM